jgi:hypothetical protein
MDEKFVAKRHKGRNIISIAKDPGNDGWRMERKENWAKYESGKACKGHLPGAFIIEEAISPLLKFLCDCLGLFVPLEPCLILLVKAPALVLE